MLAVWPFKRRSLSHRTFGRLRPVRNGRFWRARLPFRPTNSPVDVHIAGEHGPTEAQEQLYLRLADRFPNVLTVALDALHREYERVIHAQPQLKWQRVSAPPDLLRLVPLHGIWLDDGHGHKFVLSFRHGQDKDQEFHVFFRNWNLESVASER